MSIKYLIDPHLSTPRLPPELNHRCSTDAAREIAMLAVSFGRCGPAAMYDWYIHYI